MCVFSKQFMRNRITFYLLKKTLVLYGWKMRQRLDTESDERLWKRNTRKIFILIHRLD